MDNNITNSTNLSVDQPTATQSQTEKVTATTHMDVEDFEFVDEERHGMAHEIKMLKEQVLHLNTELGRMKDFQQQHSEQATEAIPVPHIERDLGEIVKPSPPKRFDGMGRGLQAFLTQLRVYFMFFPSHFTSDTNKVLFAFELLEGSALEWFEPTVQQFINNFEEAPQDVKNVMTDYRHFEDALQLMYGSGDRKHAIAVQLNRLRETDSHTRHLILHSRHPSAMLPVHCEPPPSI